MSLAELLTPQGILLDVRISSSKRLLEKIASLFSAVSHTLLDERDLFEALCERERMGTTALGNGVAIPHARIDNLDDSRGVIIRLKKGLSFDAPDEQPVDLFIGLAVPKTCTDNHSQILYDLANHLKQAPFRAGLREAKSATQLLKFLRHWDIDST